MAPYLSSLAHYNVRRTIYFGCVMHPEREANLQVRQALANLRRLNFGITASFLLNLYDDFAIGRISAEVMTQALNILENFLLRRFVCAIPTNVLNKVFPALYRQASIDGGFSLERLKAALAERGYPSDEDFKNHLVNDRMYGSGDRRDKTKFILDRLEQSFGHKEAASTANLTIEHVMPQTLTAPWQEALGADSEEQYEICLHQLGNLTLTGYNSELSNAPYSSKREHLLKSHVELNRYFAAIPKWGFDDIEARSRDLAQRALTIWPSFRPQKEGVSRPPGEVTGTKPGVIWIGDERHDVKDWCDVLDVVMTHLSEDHSEHFPSLQAECKYISNTTGKFRNPRKLTNGYFYEVNLSANLIFRVCTQVLEHVGLREHWRVEMRS